MHIICNEANEGGLQVWSQIKIESLFSGYRIQSNAANEITMSISTEALLSALKSASSTSSLGNASSAYEAEEVVMRLAKKSNQAVLSFEIAGTTRAGRRVKVAHDVKICVLALSDAQRLREPLCPDPDVHILLPSLQKLRTVVDRLRIMSDALAIRANHSGCLRVSINTEAVSVDTEWKNCIIPETTHPPDEIRDQPDPETLFSVLVSIRSFLKFLNSHVVSSSTIACICQQHCMILYVYIGDVGDAGGVLTYYIPAIISDD